MQEILNSNEKKLAAFIFCDPPDPFSGKTCLAYRNGFDNTQKGIDKFLTFAAKFSTAQYINFYGKKSKSYLGRIYIH